MFDQLNVYCIAYTKAKCPRAREFPLLRRSRQLAPSEMAKLMACNYCDAQDASGNYVNDWRDCYRLYSSTDYHVGSISRRRQWFLAATGAARFTRRKTENDPVLDSQVLRDSNNRKKAVTTLGK